MKTSLSICLILLSLAAFGQKSKLEMSAGYVFSMPRGPMSQTIEQAHGMVMDFYMRPKGKNYLLGAEMSVNSYGFDKTKQTYTFPDGTTAPMEINVSNNMFNFLVGGRYYLSEKTVQPFVSGRVGYSNYSTSLNVFDPDEGDSCEPLDSEVLKRDGALIFSAGAGIQIDLRPKKEPGTLFLTLSSYYSSGGKVDYMNVDMNAATHTHTAKKSDVYMKFLNTQTQVVHEHHIGNIYSSVIEMMDFRIGITMRVPSL